MVPVKTPGAPTGSASVKVTVSDSPVRVLRTSAVIGPLPAMSGSVIERSMSAPTVVAAMVPVASVPPSIGSVAVRVGDEPSAARGST